MNEEILIPIAFFGTIAGIWITAILAGQKNRADINDTARRAIELGQPLSPETFSFLQKPIRAPEHDLRTGIILSALALGFFATALAFPEDNPATLTATAVAGKDAASAVTITSPKVRVAPEAASAASGAASGAASDATSGVVSAASDATAASAVVTVTQSDDGATVVVTKDGDRDEDGFAQGSVDFDGDGFVIPGILVGFLGLGHLASWAIRRKKVA